MALDAGTKLGPYEILSPIGAGGMGEVYKAKDTRLDRTVAIKVLPSHVAGNPEVRQRFEREARAVSSLNHPNICTLHDIGSENGIDFMVMEHIEGDTLADRLRKGALPLDQALQYGIEVADALDKAHRQGVVHRDLKPGNIMLTKSGAKLLDFGLAKMSAAQTNAAGLSALPTEAQPLTKEGSILGTFQYMAPEQLEGKEADARTDIFAFGSVLYEMVTGKRAFEGKSQASLIAAILEHEPPAMSTLQTMTPPLLDHVVRTCLAKDPDERWQSASDVMRELAWISNEGSDAGPASSVQASGRTRKRLVLGLVAGTALGALLASIVWNAKLQPEPAGPVLRVDLALPPDQRVTDGLRVVALSPDGTHLVYRANNQLYLRNMRERHTSAIAGTDGGQFPFFSSDGQWVAFWSPMGRVLKKVSISGGTPLTLCDADLPWGASWGSDDAIVYQQGTGAILRISTAGGTPEVLVSDEGRDLRQPEMLPDGKTLLFTAGASLSLGSQRQILARSLETGEEHVLIEGASDGRYVPSGHLVYRHDGSLLAVPFDVDRLEVTGGPVPLPESVNEIRGTGMAQFSFSRAGSLVYVQGGFSQSTLVWVDRQGISRPVIETRGAYSTPRLSPDGQRLAVTAVDENNQRKVWILDLARGSQSRLTFEGDSTDPVWTPDGKTILFASTRSQFSFNIFSMPADGRGEARPMSTNDTATFPSFVSPDGKNLLFIKGLDTIGYLPLEGDGNPTILFDTPYGELFPTVSLDGRWLAYVSDESGRQQVYVRDFPDLEGKWQVSSEGGTEPLWSPRGGELFYRNGNKMMVVSVSTESTFEHGTPALLFEGNYETDPVGGNALNYHVSSDGQEFVMVETYQEALGSTQLNLVLNWFEELKKLAPTN